MKTVIEMARAVYGANTEWSFSQLERLEQFAELVRADERSACAETVYNSPPFDEYESELKAVYNAIRARSNT